MLIVNPDVGVYLSTPTPSELNKNGIVAVPIVAMAVQFSQVTCINAGPVVPLYQ